ncbi:hypothetical protein ACLOJK_027517 [Asimina triloba]
MADAEVLPWYVGLSAPLIFWLAHHVMPLRSLKTLSTMNFVGTSAIIAYLTADQRRWILLLETSNFEEVMLPCHGRSPFYPAHRWRKRCFFRAAKSGGCLPLMKKLPEKMKDAAHRWKKKVPEIGYGRDGSGISSSSPMVVLVGSHVKTTAHCIDVELTEFVEDGCRHHFARVGSADCCSPKICQMVAMAATHGGDDGAP